MDSDNPLGVDWLITVRWEDSEGRPVYDLGDIDPWAAVTILRLTADMVEESLLLPRDGKFPGPEDDEDEAEVD